MPSRVPRVRIPPSPHEKSINNRHCRQKWRNPKKKKRRLANYDVLEERVAAVREIDTLRAFQSPVRGEKIMEYYGILYYCCCLTLQIIAYRKNRQCNTYVASFNFLMQYLFPNYRYLEMISD